MSGLFHNIPGLQRQSEKILDAFNRHEHEHEHDHDREHKQEHERKYKRNDQCDDETLLTMIAARATASATDACPSKSSVVRGITGSINTISDAVDAMAMLYDRYHQMLYALAYRMVTDHQIAEDLLQETFLGVWHSAHLYAPQHGSVRTWLFSIIHHRTIDYLRQVQRHSTIDNVPLEELDLEGAPQGADAWDEAWHNLQGVHVRNALARLPDEQRFVIELAYFQGWTHSEIADGHQLPLGTVKARLRLGLTRLRRILAEMGVDEL